MLRLGDENKRKSHGLNRQPTLVLSRRGKWHPMVYPKMYLTTGWAKLASPQRRGETKPHTRQPHPHLPQHLGLGLGLAGFGDFEARLTWLARLASLELGSALRPRQMTGRDTGKQGTWEFLEMARSGGWVRQMIIR